MLDKIGHLKVEIFKIRNRAGFAAGEGKTPQAAYARMVKALRHNSSKDKEKS